MQALYWTIVTTAEFSCSFLMVITFRRIHRSLERNISADPGSAYAKTAVVTTTSPTILRSPSGRSIDNIHGLVTTDMLNVPVVADTAYPSPSPALPTPLSNRIHSANSINTTTSRSKRALQDPQKEGRRLTLLLILMAICDAFAVVSWCLTAFLPSLEQYNDEAAQFAESWAGLHYLVGLCFLSRFKSSMLVRRNDETAKGGVSGGGTGSGSGGGGMSGGAFGGSTRTLGMGGAVRGDMMKFGSGMIGPMGGSYGSNLHALGRSGSGSVLSLQPIDGGKSSEVLLEGSV
ncbi:hypothetical protein HK104_007658 [Borealophlyctis nickersoniae]|nr:hypothetical protein HK104_007658 [Borealophlyctis nickersoniae]